MPTRQRWWTYSLVGLLWLSGALWLLLDQFFARRGEFGITPHPFQAPLLLVHGVLAILSMYLFGWIAARHVSRWWRTRQRRLSGSALTATLTVLGLSGFALFFLVGDTSQHFAALLHDAAGLASVLFIVQHWFFRKSRSD
jgi:hypothetical protein